MTTSAPQLSAETWSDEQLMALPRIGKSELIDGRVIMGPEGLEHSFLCVRLAGALTARMKSGAVLGSSAGFRMRSGNVLSPDVSFVTAAHLQGMERLPKGFFRGAPDLVVEVISSRDKPAELRAKIAEYFENGAGLVWVIDPDRCTATIHATATTYKSLAGDDTLTGGAVAPEFRCKLADLFMLPDFG